MWKKRVLCLVLALCAALVMTACQQKETFPTSPQQQGAGQQPQATAPSQDVQNIFGDTPVPQQIDFNDGSYDPASEEGGNEEFLPIEQPESSGITPAPTMKSEYAGATPVLIDPIDKPTPTPLPNLTFTYVTYEAPALHLSFDGPAGWLPDDSASDTFTLTNPDPSMDYAAVLSIRCVPVSKNYNRNELTKEVKDALDSIGSDGFLKFERSNTAGRKFMNTDGVYANYAGTTVDNVRIGGRLIISCSNKMLYILNVSYPAGYTNTYVDGVYDKFRHSVKLTTAE